jgi:hypothetical protein
MAEIRRSGAAILARMALASGFFKPSHDCRVAAEFSGVGETKEILVVGASNYPNCLVLPIRLDLIRLAA